MRYLMTLILALFASLLLAGCFGSGGSGGTDYDGVWQASFVDSSFVFPTPGADQVEVCDQAPVSMTVLNGSGTTRQDYACRAVYTDAASAVAAGTAAAGATVPGTEVNFYYQIGVSISAGTAGDVLNAEVNGSIFTGKCISPQSCAAQTSTGGLSMIR